MRHAILVVCTLVASGLGAMEAHASLYSAKFVPHALVPIPIFGTGCAPHEVVADSEFVSAYDEPATGTKRWAYLDLVEICHDYDHGRMLPNGQIVPKWRRVKTSWSYIVTVPQPEKTTLPPVTLDCSPFKDPVDGTQWVITKDGQSCVHWSRPEARR